MTLKGGMMSDQSDWLSDAKFKVERARKGFAEINRSLAGLWKVTTVEPLVGGIHRYALVLRNDALERMKGLAGDVASDLMHALDHLVAARARLIGAERLKHGFPVNADDAKFEKGLKKLGPYVDGTMLDLIRRVRNDYRPWLGQIDFVREASNTSKHRQIVSAVSSVTALAFSRAAGGQEIINIPAGAFEGSNRYEFAVRQPLIPNAPLNMVVFPVLDGVTDATDGANRGLGALETTIRYLDDMVAGSASLPTAFA
jgi:hypothetical protein